MPREKLLPSSTPSKLPNKTNGTAFWTFVKFCQVIRMHSCHIITCQHKALTLYEKDLAPTHISVTIIFCHYSSIIRLTCGIMQNIIEQPSSTIQG